MTKTARQKRLARERRNQPVPPELAAHCGCLNRNGGNKVMHDSEAAAIEWMVKHLRKRSGFTLYPCPKREGIYHVATKRRR